MTAPKPAAFRGSLRERLLSRLVIDLSGCLLWTGLLNEKGYGLISVDGQMRLVHRVMWLIFNGPIPGRLQPDHLCRVRSCASLAHLELVTGRVNTLRGESPAAMHSAKTHCDSGHEFDLLNTYWTPGGARQCRACRRDYQRALRASRRAAP